MVFCLKKTYFVNWFTNWDLNFFRLKKSANKGIQDNTRENYYFSQLDKMDARNNKSRRPSPSTCTSCLTASNLQGCVVLKKKIISTNNSGSNSAVISARNPLCDHSYAFVSCIFACFILLFRSGLKRLQEVIKIKAFRLVMMNFLM